MKSLVRTTFAALGAFLVATPALAQGDAASTTNILNSGAIGAGIVMVGAAYGIGKLAASALEGMSRQPEAAGNIQTGMIIAAALIEGATFFALYICMSG